MLPEGEACSPRVVSVSSCPLQPQGASRHLLLYSHLPPAVLGNQESGLPPFPSPLTPSSITVGFLPHCDHIGFPDV